MKIAKLSINRPVMTSVMIFVFVLFGIIGYRTLTLNYMPDVEIPFVTVQTIYAGAGPKEIETLLTKPIEDVVSTISKIKRVESYSMDGVSIIILEFDLDKDVNVANQEVKDKIDQILNDLPDDADLPIVQKVDLRSEPVVDVVFSGDLDPRDLYEFADQRLTDRFAQIAGVARVDLVGGQEREIRVTMDNRVVYENAISIPQLLQVLNVQNMNLPGGYFNIKGQEYTVRLDGEFADVETIREMQIPTAFGLRKLRQIADVQDAGKDVRQRSVYFNVPDNYRDANVVRMGIVKSPEGNVVEVARGVAERIPEIEAILPAGTKLEIVSDNSVFVEATAEDTLMNIILGVLFTSIVLLIFLANIRATIIVALTMPASIISTFLLLQAFDLSLNIMTLMGLSVSVGVLVANSVVVIENIFRHKSLGQPTAKASFIGTSEVAVAVIAATMTNLIVFLPILTMSSIVGQFLKELALAASFATIFSLIFSFTMTPMLSSLIISEKEKSSKLGDAMTRFWQKWDEAYRRLLTAALKNKIISSLIVVVAFVLFIVTMMTYGPELGFTFIPQADRGKIKVEVELPEGYNLDETEAIVKKIEQKVTQYPEVLHILTSLGKISDLNVGTNLARIDIQLTDKSERGISVEGMINNFVEDLSVIPNARISVDYGESEGGQGAPIQLFLLGQNMDVLEELKDTLMVKFEDVPGLINLDQSSRSGKPEISVYPDRQKLWETGLTVQEIAVTLRSAVEGMESSKYREEGEEYDITVTLDDDAVDSPDKIANIPVVNSKGISYRLKQVADVVITRGFSKILHRDKYTAILFSASAAPGFPMGDVTQEMERRYSELELPSGYSFVWSGNAEMMNAMVADMLFAFGLAIVLTYLLLAAILESFLQPVFILLTLPLALIGVVISLYYTNLALGITALMGVIMLIGIVVNNAILMLDYTNQLIREEGMKPKEALIQACPTKLKPILMSTMAIILGMLPMALGIGAAGAEIRVPLGVVSIGGMIVSMVLTLFVIPSFYFITAKNTAAGQGQKLD